MNAEVKAKWVAALRSGEYKQAVRCLRSEDGFCCLGVLDDIHAKEIGAEWRESGLTEGGKVTYGYLGDDAILAPRVTLWAGMDMNSPYFIEDGQTIELTVLNDNGTPFTEIADLIDKYL